MSLLLIDVGNSAIHWAVKKLDQALSPMQSCVYREEKIDSLLTSNLSRMTNIEKVLISSVVGERVNTSIQQWFLKYWKVSPQFMTSAASGYGIHNAYADHTKLGSDRWAAMIAAFHLSKTVCCVLDCGTAVTFDVVEANGQHLGGWIMPGYRLFHQSLSQETTGIDVSDDTFTSNIMLGNNTQQCVDVAWHQGIVGLMQRTLSESKLNNIRCFLTGGDAQRLLPLLGKEWCYANDLVLQGLAVIASQD